METQIVLLGDCIATGQDLIWPEITGQDDFTADPLDVGQNKDLQKKLMAWFLKHNKGKVNANDLPYESNQAKIKKEKTMSWPSHIPNCLNLAVANESFQGMHKKVKKLLANQTKIDLVLITDFSATHRCIVINKHNQKFVVKRDLSFLDLGQNIWPLDVYNEFKNKVAKEEQKGAKFQQRKTIKSYNLLVKLLDSNQIPYKFLVFRKNNKYITPNHIDYTDWPKKYTDSQTDHVLCNKKLAMQLDIAKQVTSDLRL